MTTDREQPAVFLDRDGVLVHDRGPLLRAEDVSLCPDAAPSLRLLHDEGFQLIVVSNQAAVARGWLSLEAVEALQRVVERRLRAAGAPALDGFYFCPHHPKADQPAFRMACSCRKPAPGLIVRAAREHGIDRTRSFMVGDRDSDVLAGKLAGCRTVRLRRTTESEPPIEVAGGFTPVPPDWSTHDFYEAARWIVRAAAPLARVQEGVA